MTIIWTFLDDEVRRVENAIDNMVDGSVIYRDQVFIASLINEDHYDCRAVINSTSQPHSVASIRLEFTCKCMLQAYIYNNIYTEYIHTHVHMYIHIITQLHNSIHLMCMHSNWLYVIHNYNVIIYIVNH